MSNRKFAAEAIGTAWLVFAGCGTAVLAGPRAGLLGISFAFGLAYVSMWYALGHVSGCRLNPALSVGACVAGRLSSAELLVDVSAQILGGVIGTGLLLVVARQAPNGYDAVARGLAANGYGAHSPLGYSMVAALATEGIAAFAVVLVFLGVTRRSAPAGSAGIAVGLAILLAYLVAIPVTNASVNPARSTGPALYVRGWALEQLWLFWVAPVGGAVLAGLVHRALHAGE